MHKNQPVFWLDKSASEAAAFLARTELASRAVGGFVKSGAPGGIMDSLKSQWDGLAPEAKGSLIGGGVGALGGAAAGVFGKRKKNPLSTMLTGGLLGAGVGLGVPTALRAYQNAQGTGAGVGAADAQSALKTNIANNEKGVVGRGVDAVSNALGMGSAPPKVNGVSPSGPNIETPPGQGPPTLAGMPAEIGDDLRRRAFGPNGLNKATMVAAPAAGLSHVLQTPARERVKDYIAGVPAVPAGGVTSETQDLAERMMKAKQMSLKPVAGTGPPVPVPPSAPARMSSPHQLGLNLIPGIGDSRADNLYQQALKDRPELGIGGLAAAGRNARIKLNTRHPIRDAIGGGLGRMLGTAAITEGAPRVGKAIMDQYGSPFSTSPAAPAGPPASGPVPPWVTQQLQGGSTP